MTIGHMYPQPSPFELEMLARREQEARERLHAARDRNTTDESAATHESLIHRLEEDWKKALERLEHARRARHS